MQTLAFVCLDVEVWNDARRIDPTIAILALQDNFAQEEVAPVLQDAPTTHNAPHKVKCAT
jgi:hypothetical protein